MRFQLALNKTFCPNPQPFTHRQVKQRQRTKINKTILTVPFSHPSSVFPQKIQYQNWNANKYSILTLNELGPPVLESSARTSRFYPPTDSEHKLNKTEIENLLSIGYNLGTTLETFHLPETVQVLSSPTRKHYTHAKLRHLACDRSKKKLSNPWGSKKNLGIISLPHSRWLKPERERDNFRLTQRAHVVQPHQEQKEKLIS